jgi:hypothetical protein
MKIKNYALFFSVLFLFALSSFAQTPEEMVKNDWPNTVETFGKNSKTVPSHYIFVIDVTEQIFGPEISKQIRSFVDALPENDNITIIQLGPTDETFEIVPTCKVTPKIKVDIFEKLKLIEFGKSGSDGLKMTDCVIKALNAPGVSKSIPFVFIFSDFEFYLPGDGYFIPSTSEWGPLKAKFEQTKRSLSRGENLIINGLRLSNPNQRNNYFDKLKFVFGSISPTTVSGSNLLKAQFNNIQAGIYRERLINYVSEQLKVQNDNMQLENNDGQIVLKGSDTLVYHKLILDKASQDKVNEILNSEVLYAFFPPTAIELEVSGILVAEKYKNELLELADLQINKQMITLMQPEALIPWWLTDLILLVIIAMVLRFIWVLMPIKLHGMITFSSMDNFRASENNFLCDGRNSVTIGAVHQYPEDKKLFGNEEFYLTLSAKRKYFKGKCIELAPFKGDLKRKNKNTVIQRGNKLCTDKKSFWTVNGITIGLPGVK